MILEKGTGTSRSLFMLIYSARKNMVLPYLCDRAHQTQGIYLRPKCRFSICSNIKVDRSKMLAGVLATRAFGGRFVSLVYITANITLPFYGNFSLIDCTRLDHFKELHISVAMMFFNLGNLFK